MMKVRSKELRKLSRKARFTVMMDAVMRCINDEEDPGLYRWLVEGCPDGSTPQDIADYVDDREDGEQTYKDWCVIFAEEMANLIYKGNWDDNGRTLELYNSGTEYCNLEGEIC